MKLIELLKSVNIEDVYPIIDSIYCNGESRLEFIKEKYKLTYDELMNTEVTYYPEDYECMPGENPREIWIEDDEGESEIPSAQWLEGEIRSMALGKEIILKNRKMLSNEELAAICLFHITFYGFTQEDVDNYFRKLLGNDKEE